MRRTRVVLAGLVTVSLAIGLSAPVVAQSDEESVQPPAEFQGRLTCPASVFPQDTVTANVILGPAGDGNFVRRESRGDVFHPVVEEMSDPRLAGTWSAYLNTDEYIYPGVDMQDHPTVQTGVQRIENDEGAWQGSAPDAYFPGLPWTKWGLLVLAGEGAYGGLTALQWTNLVDETCACWEPDNQCEWEIRGFVFEGELPPFPELPAE